MPASGLRCVCEYTSTQAHTHASTHGERGGGALVSKWESKISKTRYISSTFTKYIEVLNEQAVKTSFVGTFIKCFLSTQYGCLNKTQTILTPVGQPNIDGKNLTDPTPR